MNTLTVVTPALTAGAQRVTITNPDGETDLPRRRLHRQLTPRSFVGAQNAVPQLARAYKSMFLSPPSPINCLHKILP